MTNREAFELWATDEGLWPNAVRRSELNPQQYASMTTTQNWIAWKAGATFQREACALRCEQLGMSTNGINERNHECAVEIRKMTTT